MITNQEVYNNGEIQEIQYSRKRNGVKYYYYTIYYNREFYEIVVSDDDISQEVERPNGKPKLITQTRNPMNNLIK